jgi:glycosyltransferase involved in cell wall biosynthesis
MTSGVQFLSIAMIGTRGVPARYGGFETAVEEIGTRLAERGHKIVVYCRNPGQNITEYQGMHLVNLPALRRRSLETLSHTALSVAHAATRRPDMAFVFNAANAPLLPFLRARCIPVAVHVDGIEWQRAKWHGAGRRYYRWAERACARSGLDLIADSRGIKEHLLHTYGAESHFIPYGAPILSVGSSRLGELRLETRCFHLVVARFEPENHVLEIVRGYVASSAVHPLIVVGGAAYGADYSELVRKAADDDPRVRFLGGLFDQDLLDQLYGNATSYLHGHSVGGTNPSLLRALGAGATSIAFDVSFNREVAGEDGEYFTTPEDLGPLLHLSESDHDAWLARGVRLRDRMSKLYRWDRVSDSYEQLARDAAARRT